MAGNKKPRIGAGFVACYRLA